MSGGGEGAPYNEGLPGQRARRPKIQTSRAILALLGTIAKAFPNRATKSKLGPFWAVVRGEVPAGVTVADFGR